MQHSMFPAAPSNNWIVAWRILPMALDRKKFKLLIHYICSMCEPSQFGSVKLNKILWVADFQAYYELGKSITGARYVKRQHGPVPSTIVPILDELSLEGLLSITEEDFHGFPKRRFEAFGTPDLSRLTEDEIRIVNTAIKFVIEHTARPISKLSHDHIWRTADDGEEIPYYTVFALPGEITESDREWARTMLGGIAE
jgi:hypothetical protein